ncbi:cytoplasmic protein [Streptomyces sp. WAC05374]|uniref:MSMEG_6728 family protein n=1 Tax=Streptomyces sp. WAC05374 TaxID=2487420 RepID=UPI000F89541F|nr:MSMEG_6728 family protein [Streptomyces sp. WAC05374]RST08653.1 cytoplasmic protein [Streptomyces sp. WAC05374]TDF50534.1 cytoplasmic protein [Streptomyces sp. WAC05374]TDF56823.1 cytoplasmic protein [Streptomyces sp. WAC05374]TDF60786.1 cytoplasmic protein [Streptomyces sp. WAC05374]
MQTFLPFPCFEECARALDPRRLGKQRVEALQVLRGLTVPGYGWRRHPAVRMWTGYEEALVRYGLEVCEAWTARGHRDTCADSLLVGFHGVRPGAPVRRQAELAEDGELPPWLGDPGFHLSHRSALVRKDPGFYTERFGDVPADLPYVWPGSDRDPENRPPGDV